MVKVYANLIINGMKTIDNVPLKLKEQVINYLIELGFEIE